MLTSIKDDRWPLGKRTGEVLRVQVDLKGWPFIRSSKQMTDLKTSMILVFEASKDQTARYMLQGPRQIAVPLASPRRKNLRERYTSGTLSSATLDVQLLQTNPGKEFASKVFGVEIKDDSQGPRYSQQMTIECPAKLDSGFILQSPVLIVHKAYT
ncbi:hypothetical protein ARMSODRAFT_1061490 [Armillaria solidipes]|uniref:Uncharacterized protein n=1 Tax=Armillaria solidipes TaxID=1076256 RepID=A0A2H3B053_9AGAR|nr:hypothetical protein ARMSODRAFT_1061490 [Armillaria solidipes]